ncbi:hypothetical protein BH24ACT5_BH24ACT5_04410 [soil metagenome]
MSKPEHLATYCGPVLSTMSRTVAAVELPEAFVTAHVAEQHRRLFLEQAARQRLIRLARGERPAGARRWRFGWRR